MTGRYREHCTVCCVVESLLGITATAYIAPLKWREACEVLSMAVTCCMQPSDRIIHTAQTIGIKYSAGGLDVPSSISYLTSPLHRVNSVLQRGTNNSKSEIITKSSFFPGMVTYRRNGKFYASLKFCDLCQ